MNNTELEEVIKEPVIIHNDLFWPKVWYFQENFGILFKLKKLYELFGLNYEEELNNLDHKELNVIDKINKVKQI